MQKLYTKEEKLSNRPIFLLLSQNLVRSCVNRIVFHQTCLLMISKISWIDRFVFLIFASSDNLAQIEETYISIDQYPIMGKLTIVSIMQSCRQFCPSHVIQQESVIPVKKFTLRALFEQHLVSIGQFVIVLILQSSVKFYLLDTEPLSAQLCYQSLLKFCQRLILLMVTLCPLTQYRWAGEKSKRTEIYQSCAIFKLDESLPNVILSEQLYEQREVGE